MPCTWSLLVDLLAASAKAHGLAFVPGTTSDGEEEELKTPAGRHCCSYRAGVLALASGLERILLHPRRRDEPHHPMHGQHVFAGHSPGWPRCSDIPAGSRRVARTGGALPKRQPDRRGVEVNERADAVARDAAALPQRNAPAECSIGLQANLPSSGHWPYWPERRP